MAGHYEVEWWHAQDDRNVSFTAARPLVDRLPNAWMRLLGSWHLEPYHRHEEILDDLLTRGG
jgi:hypothetical protein